MNDSRRGRCRHTTTPGLPLTAALLVLLGSAGGTWAQIELPHPNPLMRPATPAATAPPPAVRAVPAGRAWLLELAEPTGGAALQATGIDRSRPSPLVQPGRFRTVSTPTGAWVIEDAQATNADVAVPATQAGPVRTVELRTAEDFARAMAAPEPMTIYRVVK